MIRKIVNTTSLLSLLVFLMPTITQLEHHHKHLISNVVNDKHYPVFQEKCAICDFEFSVFSSDYGINDLQKETPLAKYCNNYHSKFHSNLSQFSSLLRAPPVG